MDVLVEVLFSLFNLFFGELTRTLHGTMAPSCGRYYVLHTIKHGAIYFVLFTNLLYTILLYINI